MKSLSSVVCSISLAFASLFVTSNLAAQQRAATGSISGIVVNEAGSPIPEAALVVSRSDGSASQNITSTNTGTFTVSGLQPGLYRISARRIGFREARMPFLRVVAGQTSEIRITLTSSPTELSTVEVRVTATSIDASTTELTQRIELPEVALVPMGRDAAALVDLVPGSKRGYVWGGAGDAANNYQIDGVSVNHPGSGGDFLSPSIDWIEALEVRGLGAGAEYGGFQGGIINAVTRTGTNQWKAAVRSNFTSPATTASNVQPNEEGAEQTLRTEIGADMSGPIVRDRLFYFLGGIFTDRRLQIPDLYTAEPDDFRSADQEFRDVRGIAKLTFRPGPYDRLDALVGHTDNRIENAELNGLDDPAAALQVRAPTTFYELGWSRATVGTTLNARLVGFESRESRLGYLGDNVPAIQIFTPGRQPVFQNAVFNDRVKPRSLGGALSWSREHSLGSGSNKVVVGAELTRGSWTKDRTRNGGMTWMPYLNPQTKSVDPARPETWLDAASEWGGDIHINADVEDAAVYIQDYLTLRPNLTITPGVRFGRWSGWLTPPDDSNGKFLAVRDQAFDPRIGVVWDVTRKNDFVIKAHWGRYHQAMSALFFDRAEGGNSYQNEQFYFQGPAITDPRKIYTPAERDALSDSTGQSGFSSTFVETITNEAGAVADYRQPYVQQAVLSVEKRFGPRWKLEVAYTNRSNKDIVGLVDRNLAENYSPITDIGVRDRVFQTTIHDHNGEPLRLPVIWVSNQSLRADLIRRRDSRVPRPPVPGYTFADIARLTFNPDVVLTTVPDAERKMHQLTASLRTQQEKFDWFASVSYTDLRGNVGGLTGFSTNALDFTAGPGVRPNERINYEGRLPNIPAFDIKSWITGPLFYGFTGGAFASLTLGEYFEPNFRITPRFRFLDENDVPLADSLFNGVVGQTLLIEERGTRKYPSNVSLDLRLERPVEIGRLRATFTGDLFNALGSDVIVERNLTVNDAVSTDPTSLFGAPRRRVTPMRLQIGLRIER
jgi:hypothetical protein